MERKAIVLQAILSEHVWLALVLWGSAYISDYYCTIWAARLYHTRAKAYIVFEGSFELTPVFQHDVDRLRMVSWRFLCALLLSCLGLLLVWWLSIQYLHTPLLFWFLLGALVLREAAIHIRHVRNIALFHTAKNGGNLQGQIVYSRWLTLQLSCVDLMGFAGLFLLIFLVAESWFCLGGAVACGVTAQQHHALARQAKAAPPRG